MKGFILIDSAAQGRIAKLLENKGLQNLLAILNQSGEEARIAGGAVRNALIGESISDVDIATTCLPNEVRKRAQAAGFKAVPTGIEHGTLTIVVEGAPYEVTTLRADVATDGRRAEVAFGRDWQTDAERRDFTVNGLYADAQGNVIDLVGGIADISSRTIRFIGSAEKRIGEDHLRILRFFRFFAWYGSGRPDAEGLKACARLKETISLLSAERVWSELKKLLSAPDPSRALLWMRQSGVLTAALPESEKWGIDAVHGLAAVERELGWAADPMLRLMSIVPPRRERCDELADRLKLSKSERARLEEWTAAELPMPDLDNRDLSRLMYRGDKDGICDRLKLALAAARGLAANDDKEMMKAAGYARLLDFALVWRKPVFPVKGADLLALGLAAGPEVGERLKALEENWAAGDFALSKADLLKP
jgi:poly(A) polymerase